MNREKIQRIVVLKHQNRKQDKNKNKVQVLSMP